MELWIRSQDGECLLKTNRIDCDYSKGGYEIYVGGYETLMGIYDTKERALMILDEIQSILQPKVIFHEPKIDYNDLIGSCAENVVIKANQQVEYDLKNARQIVYVMPPK